MATGASSSGSDAKDVAAGRLGGARADFVASLGRKVADARDILAAIEAEPSSIAARSEMRRRMHALGTGARLLHFGSMASAIQEGITVLDRGSHSGEIGRDDVGFLAQLLDDLPALVWGDAPSADVSGAIADAASADSLAQLPLSVLVVGAESLADLLMDGSGTHTYECERTDDVTQARELARAYAPDLVLLDADRERAAELVALLLEDPLTEPVPVIVVGTFRAPEDEARFVALGVARSIAKPASGDMIRRVCDDVLDARQDRTMRVTLGEPTLEQLAERLAQELKGALIDGVDPAARASRVPLGEGTEVLGALWGAIARVREIVQQKTGGAVRFAGGAPEGAIALAPWLHQDLPAADRVLARGRGLGADVRLQGRRVVVADDDPGVTWFLSDLLRTAGCEVHEALDGVTARELAFRVQPELVVSDILMPGLDGFALCRALKRDVALRDTPVILLSWKEDLLQRVRELGASAAAYMRKESDSRAVLARVREVLLPRARIEARLRAAGEVRGRLDGLTPRLLLDLVCTLRRDARVAVRDATCLYEIEIRGGSPRRATRTASDGGHQGGEAALGRMLGVGAGRFVVSPSTDPVRPEMSGSLYELLAKPLAAARGALAATTGAKVMDVDRILLDAAVLDEYLAATPDPARTLLRQLAQGASPRQMVIDGAVSPSLMEDVLGDLAARCAIRAVVAEDGTDLLSPAVEAALTTLTTAAPSSPSRAPGARASVAPAPFASAPPRAEPSRSEPRVPMSVHAEPRLLFPERALVLSDPPPPPPLRSRSAPPASDDEGPPSSLEDAVMRELSDRSPVPGGTHPSSPELPPIIEPSALRPRSSNPPANEVVAEPEDRSVLPSIPPDAVVPGASSVDEYVAAPAASTLPGAPSIPPLEEAADPFAAAFPAPLDPTPVAPPPRMDEASETPEPILGAEAPSQPPVGARAPSHPPPAASRSSVAPPEPAAAVRHATASDAPPAPQEPEAPRGADPLWFVLAFAVLGGAVAAALRVSNADSAPVRQRAPETTVAAVASPATPAPPPAASLAAPAPTPTPSAAPDDLPSGVDAPPGYGVLDILLPEGAAAQVDGRVVAPLSAVPAGHHRVHVEVNGRVREFETDVRAGHTTHARPPTSP